MFSRLTDKYRLLQHLAAFTIAWVSAWLLFIYVLRPITVPQPSPGYHADTLGKGEAAVHNLLYLSSALRNGKVVVVLGSSELEQALWNPYTPNIFFPRHRLARVLTYGKAGFETLEAADGPAALALFAAEAPDLIVLDITLPGEGDEPAADPVGGRRQLLDSAGIRPLEHEQRDRGRLREEPLTAGVHPISVGASSPQMRPSSRTACSPSRSSANCPRP